jgi:GNAT superfamily N-acetyltransferase
MKINELTEAGVGKITKHNTTVDVKPGETERQAAKLFPMNKDGKPKSMGVKGATPNQAFNLGLTENMSVTGTERRRLEKKKGIQVGTPEWFKHWFDLPYLREDITKQELLAKLKDQQRGRYIKAMLDAMHKLVQSKGARHSIGNYAYEIAKTFGYNPKDLEKMYRDTYNVSEDVTQPQLNALEKAVDNVFGRIGIDVEFTRHFLDRANDERNGEPITIQELGKLFAKEYKRWGKPIAQMGPDTEAVMKDLESDINIPFALRWNGTELELIAKTVMRKKNFSTSNKQFPVENTQGSLAQKINWGGQNKSAKKPTPSKQQDMSWWQRLQQRAFGDADVNESINEVSKEEFDAIQNGYVDIEFDKKWWPLDDDYPLIKHIGKAIGATSWTNWGKVGVPWSETEMIGGGGTYMLKGDFGHILLDAAKSFSPEQILMAQISTSNRGGGVGVKVMNAIKSYADQKGLPITIYKVTNQKFFDKFEWLEKTGADTYEYSSNVEENFADGKVKGKSRPGRVKKSGASCNGSVTALRKRAKNASGEKAKMYHWCANMKAGKNK